MDDHRWDEVTEEDVHKYQIQFENLQAKYSLLVVLQKEYFLDILAGNNLQISRDVSMDIALAITILSITKSTENVSRIFEIDFLDQLKFFFFIFDHQQYSTLRPCQSLQHIIQHCQWRNYITLVNNFPQYQ